MGINEIVNQANVDGWIAEHRDLYREDGQAGHMWNSAEVGGPGPVPTLLLTTVGARTGRTSVMPLIYGHFDEADRADEYVVIASKGGSEHHPGWYHNLLASETVTVQVADDVFEATGRTLTGDERLETWARMREIYPPYDEYQARTDREIPVVVLTRVQR
jgi:deazaflavin-dependent oxidoreductase (nitroreductase family)